MGVRPSKQVGNPTPVGGSSGPVVGSDQVGAVSTKPKGAEVNYEIVSDAKLRAMLEEQATDLNIQQPDDIADAIAALDGAIT